MPVCLKVKSNNTIELQPDANLGCDLYGLDALEIAQFQTVLGVVDITPEQILYVYTWGMGAILLPFSIAYAVKWVIRLLKSI